MRQDSVWESETWLAPAHVVVVGAGVLGLWTAIEFKRRQPASRVVIIEAQPLPLGASTRNAGFVCFGSATELLGDIKILGTNEAMAIVQQRYAGIQKIASEFNADSIGLQWCGGYECLWENNVQAVANQLPVLNQLLQSVTGESCTYQFAEDTSKRVHFSGFAALVCNKTEGVLHSGKYVQALEAKARGLGVEIMYGAEVSSVIQQGEQQNISTTTGSILAKKLVFATNAYLARMFPQSGIKPARGQMVLIKPELPLQWSGAFHAHEGYYYWRNLNGMLLLGGARHINFAAEETTTLDVTEELMEHLKAFAATHLIRGKFDVVKKWSGLMAFTPNKKPLLAQVAQGQWIATCCNGMGVALSPIFAATIADTIVSS